MTSVKPFAYREIQGHHPLRRRRALMVMRDERDISILRRQLDRLGMTVADMIRPGAATESIR